MAHKQGDIASAIGSRICHDLISPIGAISNGLELLTLSGTPKSPELDLIEQSVKGANAKLRFLRIAFGDSGTASPVGTDETASILSETYSDGRVDLQWLINVPLDRSQLKTCFLMLLCIEKMQPFGGKITIQTLDGQLIFVFSGRELKLESFIDFQDECFLEQSGPTQIQFGLLQNMIDEKTIQMKTSLSENTVRITLAAGV